jgi:trimeric autotransporter adhesin
MPYLAFSKYMRFVLALMISAIMAACGGGGGGSTNTAPTIDLTPIIISMAPSSAAAGTKITVTGKNLGKVATIRIGKLSFAPSSASDTTLTFTVPTGARSAKIELISPDGTSLSSAVFTVTGVPTVGSMSPTTIVAGQNFFVTGTNLNLIQSVTLNGVTLTIAKSATQMTVTLPDTAVDGLLTLIGTDGGIDTVQITVSAPIKFTSFTPTSGLVGADVTLNGTGLSRVTSVNFTGTTTAASIGVRSATSISVTVPAGAATGPIKLNGIPGESASSATNFTVIPRITVSSGPNYTATAAGFPVTITGTGLDQVSSVTVASTNAGITSKSATQLVFSAPGISCGAITLSSLNQPSVSAGNLSVGAGCGPSSVNISAIEFAQIFSQAAGVTYQRLAPGKETWVRAYITSPTAGQAAPAVRLTGLSGSTVLGSLTMIGSPTLPQLAVGSTPTNAMRYQITQTFRVQLPDAWVAKGLKVRVEVDPTNPAGPLATQESTPVVGEPISLEIVLVPLISGNVAPTMPPTATFVDAIVRAFPVPRSRLTVTTRAPFNLKTVFPVPTSNVDTGPAWGDAIDELYALQQLEVPDPKKNFRIYYGFVRVPQYGIAGVAAGAAASLGKDFTWDTWERIVVHEIGHNLSLGKHVYCGAPYPVTNTTEYDAAYPYDQGLMGPTPIFNSLTDLIIDPTTNDNNIKFDAMGYCGGYWLSDYNVTSKVQPDLERRTKNAGILALQEKTAQTEINLIRVSGVIDDKGARITRVLAAQGIPQINNPTGYEIELTTAQGQIIRAPLQINRMSQGEAMLFSVSLAYPGQLVAMRVLRNGQLIGERTAVQQQKAEAGFLRAATDAPWARVKESGASATFEWNVDYGTATITHLMNGQRTVLTISKSGGRAELDISHLPRGGVFEVGLSDGLNVQSLTLTR